MSCKCGRTGLCDTCCCVGPSHRDKRGLQCSTCGHPDQQPAPAVQQTHRWVHVVVFEYPSPTRPVVVNVYGFHTKKEAETSQRRSKREEVPGGLKVIANRVRPVLVDGIDYGFDVPREAL